MSAHGVGDILDIPPADAQLLIAEDWAVCEDVDAADRAEDAGRSSRRRRKRAHKP